MSAAQCVPVEGIGEGLLKRFVAANLRFQIDRCGLNQREFAKAIKVSESTVSSWLSGDTLPRDNVWPRILRVLGARMEDLTRDPTSPVIATPYSSLPLPDDDTELTLRYLRRQAKLLGYELQKLPSK
jgi:transcriptional regulator with XRE-family HTH domain